MMMIDDDGDDDDDDDDDNDDDNDDNDDDNDGDDDVKTYWAPFLNAMALYKKLNLKKKTNNLLY